VPADLTHLGLVVSVAAAVAFRFFSDFSFATIEHQAALANFTLNGLTLPNLFTLSLTTLSYQLQRDWFNLTPQAPAEILGVIVACVLLYALLRRAAPPAVAAATVMAIAPFAPVLVTVSACAWLLARSA
jgi:hypothetical protein